MSPCRIEDDPPCHDQRFLVGHGDFLACADRVESREQPRRTHQPVDDDVNLVDGRNLPEAGGAREHGDARRQVIPHSGFVRPVGDADVAGPPGEGPFNKLFYPASGAQGNYRKPVPSQAFDDAESRIPYGSGASEDGDRGGIRAHRGLRSVRTVW